MNIVTVSREFGSGGREFARGLARELGWAYYDRELVEAIARESSLNKERVEKLAETGVISTFPATFRRTLSLSGLGADNATRVLVAQQKVLRQLAARGENCVIVGRGADVVLREHGPVNLFVYADMAARLRRCRERAGAEEKLTDRELERQIRRVDAGRARYRQMLTGSPWGHRESYHLCLNTTGLDIGALSAWTADYVRFRFGEERR